MRQFEVKYKPQDMSVFKPGDIVRDGHGTIWVRRNIAHWDHVFMGEGDYAVNERLDGDDNCTVDNDWLQWRVLTLLVRDGQPVIVLSEVDIRRGVGHA